MASLAAPCGVENIAELLSREEVTLRFPHSHLGPLSLRRVKTSQCQVACPLGTDVKGYVGLIAAGKFQKSLELIRETNPFPAICGRVCLHPCEPECLRGDVDAPIAIRDLKRFVADYQLRHPPEEVQSRSRNVATGERIAIVGSGPAGLTAANDLARWGFRVTVFEALPIAGGMLSVGIPPFRLPKDIVAVEIAAIAADGVEIRTEKKIRNPRRLLRQGYRAVLLATGAHRGLKMGIPGENLEGCVDALTFLREVHLGHGQKPGKRVVVIGAGYAALDAARTALRLGCDQVDVIYRRSKEELPHPQLAKETQREGIKISYHLEPTRVLGRNGRVGGLVCHRMRSGSPDDVGRRATSVARGSPVILRADGVIFAIHQEPDLSFLPARHPFQISPWNSLVIDPVTMATGQEGIFAAGDVVSGPKSVIEAMAMGHQAAAAIRNYLRGQAADQSTAALAGRQSEIVLEDWVPQEKPRLRVERTTARSWEGHFGEVVLTPSEDRARKEALRCLMCGPCDECRECIAGCEKKLLAIALPGAVGQEALVRIPWLSERFPHGSGPWEVVIERPGGDVLQAVAAPVVCDVWEQLCRGCAECVQACQYEARRMVTCGDGVVISEVDQSICRGCGACVAVCPTGASIVGHFSDWRLVKTLERMLKGPQGVEAKRKKTEPRLIAFACHWSAYPLLESGMTSLPVDLQVIRVMCLGSISSGLVLRAFEMGADGVMLLGCSPESCHYGFGAQVAETQLATVQKLMPALGIEKSRLRLEAVATGEQAHLARVVKRFASRVGQLGPSPLVD